MVEEGPMSYLAACLKTVGCNIGLDWCGLEVGVLGDGGFNITIEW